MHRPLLVGRGPWAQKIHAALKGMGVEPTIVGSMMAVDSIRNAHARGNDSVIIASSTPSHAELLVQALRMNLPIFCEKPLVSSVAEMNQVQDAGHYERALSRRAPVVCDYVHAWTEGFEHAWNETRKSGIISKFEATFGGDVQRADCHPVWDYGCHPIAMALLLGVNLDGLKLTQPGSHEWFLVNDHASIRVYAYPKGSAVAVGLGKSARISLGEWCEYGDGIWEFSHGSHFKNVDAPPLQRALKGFFWRVAYPKESNPEVSLRFGLDLSMKVTKVLESLCPCRSAP